MKISCKTMFAWCASFMIAGALLIASLSGCSPQEKSESGNDTTKESTISVSFSMDVDCGICHAEEQASTTNTACLASKHASEATCTTCHNEESKLTTEHEGATADAKMPKRLKKTDVSSDICLSCHSDEDRIAETADVTVCTDSEGTTINPHDLPADGDHEAIGCIDCHEEHTEKSALEVAPDECLSCHHADVYECYTCHD